MAQRKMCKKQQDWPESKRGRSDDGADVDSTAKMMWRLISTQTHRETQ